MPVAEYQSAVSKMLEKGVKDLGLAGNTAAEASTTITGSLGMMKSAWGNLLTAMASGEGLDQCIDNMVKAVETFGVNVLPVAEKALLGIGTLIERVAPMIEQKLPDLIEQFLPPLIRATVSLVKGLIKALPGIVRSIANELPDIIKELMQTITDTFGGSFGALDKFGEFVNENADKIKKLVPVVLGLVAAFKAFGGIKSIFSFPEINPL